MSFQQGLSGLNTTAKALDTIGNNVSNSGTVGFKAATAQFADVFAASLGSGGASQIGIGSSLARVAQQFTQGNITNTNNPLDMSINGSGMYRMTTAAGTITYTRAGQFQLDKSGYIINSAGLKLTGYAADPTTGTISPGNLVPLQVLNTNIAPKVTSASSMQLNLDSRALPPSAMSSGSLTGAAAPVTVNGFTTITQGSNDVLDLIVDDIAVSVTIPPGTNYTTAGLATTLTSLINSALTGTGAAVTVNNSSTGQLIITSNSKGSIGSTGQGSTVTLNGLGGSAASTLLRASVTTSGPAAVATPGTPTTPGVLTGQPNLPTSVTFTTPQTIVMTVGATTQTVTLAATADPLAVPPVTVTYQTNDGPPSGLQAAVDAAVAAAFGAAAATSSAVDGLPLAITAAANDDDVTVGAMTSEIQALFDSPGILRSGANLPTSVSIGSGESFTLTVDGVTSTVTVPQGSYSTTGTPSLQTALQNAIDVQFAPAGTVTVSAVSGSPLTITSGTLGAGSQVGIGAMTSGIQALFGPTTVAGADNFNQITSQTSGTLTSGVALDTAVPRITTDSNDTLNIVVDGHAVTVTLASDVAPGGITYNGVAPNPPLTDLAVDVETKINNALAAIPTSARVTASINSNNKLVIQSNSAGANSTVALGNSAGGTAATTLFGAAPVTVAGNQTQTVNALGFTASTPQTVYDSQGNPHNLSLYFVKTSQGNVWQMYSTLDNGQQQGPTTLTFNGSGALQTTMPITLPAQGQSYTFLSTSTNASRPDPLQFTLDLTGTTQYGVSFSVNNPNQDGYSSGQLSGISVGSNGVIQGRFSNGQSKNMGQIVLVNFNNPNGLQSLGGNQWAETTESGQPMPGIPGSGSLGLIQSAAVEESNVDLTKELVDMITQQRVYQANAQTIKTQDQVLQTLVNLR